MNKLTCRVASVTDRGLSRPENQDSFYISPDERVFVVADGMGGVKGGAEASRIAVETIQELWKEDAPHPTDEAEIRKWLLDAVARANHNICDAADSKDSASRMGTTIVVAVQSDANEMHIAHVGDSRAYILKEGRISTLTNDHTVVMEMMRNNKLTEEQCRNSVYRHLLTRCLGHDRDVEIDHTDIKLSSGEWIILCSDGLSGVLTDEQILESMKNCDTAQDVCQKLLAKTLDHQAPDNVTIVAIQYQKGEEAKAFGDANGASAEKGAESSGAGTY